MAASEFLNISVKTTDEEINFIRTYHKNLSVMCDLLRIFWNFTEQLGG